MKVGFQTMVGYATGLFLLAASALWLFDLNPFPSEITVYSVYRGRGG